MTDKPEMTRKPEMAPKPEMKEKQKKNKKPEMTGKPETAEKPETRLNKDKKPGRYEPETEVEGSEVKIPAQEMNKSVRIVPKFPDSGVLYSSGKF